MLRTTLLLLLAVSQAAVGQVERDTRRNRPAPAPQSRHSGSFRVDDLFVPPKRAGESQSGNRDVYGQARRFGRVSGLDDLMDPKTASRRFGRVTERSQTERSSSDRPAESGPDKTLYLRWLADQMLPGSEDQQRQSFSNVPDPSESSTTRYPPEERSPPAQPLPNEPADVASTAIPELVFEPRQIPITGHLTSFADESVPPRRELAVEADVSGADPFAYFSRNFQQLRPFTPILPAILSSDAVSPRTKSYLAREYETQFWQAVGAGLHAR